MPPASVWLVVLSYNGLEDTRRCLTSVAEAVRPGVTTLLVDNGSNDGTAAAVAAEFPWCRIHTVTENRGPAAGNNAGIRVALAEGCDWIVLLNNDTTVDPGLVDRLREAAEANSAYAILGPVIYFMADPDTVMTDGCIFNAPDFDGFFQRKVVPLRWSRPPRVVEVDVVNGCCMMIRADVLRRIGLFDEEMFIYHDETDLCLRAREAGYRAGVIDHALVWHKGSATFSATGKRSARYYDARNLAYVLRKHGGARTRRRTRLQSAAMYGRYMYYWYCAEREAGHEQSADAVIEGMCDAVAGRAGRYEPRSHVLLGAIRRGFEFVRRRRGSLTGSAHPST